MIEHHHDKEFTTKKYRCFDRKYNTYYFNKEDIRSMYKLNKLLGSMVQLCHTDEYGYYNGANDEFVVDIGRDWSRSVDTFTEAYIRCLHHERIYANKEVSK